MYQSIYQYATGHNLVAKKNRCNRLISAYIKLNQSGDYLGVEIIPKKERIKKSCPDVGSFAFSGRSTAIICEKACYILSTDGFGDAKRHSGWIEVMRQCGDADPNVKPIVSFINKVEEEKTIMSQILCDVKDGGLKDKDFISFRIGNQNAEDLTSWEGWFDSYMEKKYKERIGETEKVLTVSSMTGKLVNPITRGNMPLIKTPQTGTGSYIASFGEAAFCSYGRIDNSNTPLSEEEGDAIRAGLEHLFISSHNHNNDFSFLYWYENDVPDLLGTIFDASNFQIVECVAGDEKKRKEIKREKNYQETLEVIRTGEVIQKQKTDTEYHIIQYSVPDKGRMSLSRERKGRYLDLYDNLQNWYSDTRISTREAERTLCNFYRILYALLDNSNAKDKRKEINNEYGQAKMELLNSIVEGKQIPKVFYRHAERIIDRFVVQGEDLDSNSQIRIALQLTKAYLIRGGFDMDSRLNTENTSIAYQCGRWLATMNFLQKKALGKVNTTLAQKLYKGAKRNPAKVLNLCTDNREAYLKKIESEGLRRYYEKMLSEISEQIGTCFPEKFNDMERGAFDLGFAQQQQMLYKGRANKEDRNTEEKEME